MSSNTPADNTQLPATTTSLPLRHLTTNETIPFSSLYTAPTPQPVVAIFLRRWGCQLCRGYAKKLTTTLLPTLQHNNVRLVAIGFDTPGSDQWLDGSPYFPASQLYQDTGRKLYNALGVKRPSALSGLMKLMSSSTRTWNAEVKAMGIQGDYAGDGMQLGATFVVSPAGALWMERRQADYGDHPSADEIVSVLRSHMKEWKDSPSGGGGGSDGAADETVQDESVRKGVDASLMASPVSSVKVLESFGSGSNKCNDDCF